MCIIDITIGNNRADNYYKCDNCYSNYNSTNNVNIGFTLIIFKQKVCT